MLKLASALSAAALLAFAAPAFADCGGTCPGNGGGNGGGDCGVVISCDDDNSCPGGGGNGGNA